MSFLKKKNMPADRRLVKKGQFRETWDRLKKSKRAMISLAGIILIILLAAFAGVLFDYQADCVTQHIRDQYQTASWQHLFGTDQVGRDLCARTVYGCRVALEIGFGTTLIALAVGIVLGCTSAFFGGWVDNLIMRVTDIFSTIPPLVLSMAIVAGLGNGVWQLMVAIGVGEIPQFIRLIRAKGLSVVNMEFIEAGKALGAKNGWLIARYIFPNVISVVLVQGTIEMARAVLTGATLSFIGLGVEPPTPEWGSMLQEAIPCLQLYPRLVLIPGAALVFVSLCINTFGDCLRDAMDPQLKA